MSGRGLTGGRMAELLRRPNMDTRFHLKLAVVERVVVDPQEGIFADVTLIPNEEPETVFVGAPYAGGGFGFYFPLEEGDTVLIGIPDGNCDMGPILISRMWDAGDRPFAEMKGAPSDEPEQFEPSPDVILRAKPGANTRIIVSAGANVSITVEGAGSVNLQVDGGSVHLGMSEHTALQGVVQGEAYDPFTGQTQTALGNASSKVFARKS